MSSPDGWVSGDDLNGEALPEPEESTEVTAATVLAHSAEIAHRGLPEKVIRRSWNDETFEPPELDETPLESPPFYVPAAYRDRSVSGEAAPQEAGSADLRSAPPAALRAGTAPAADMQTGSRDDPRDSEEFPAVTEVSTSSMEDDPLAEESSWITPSRTAEGTTAESAVGSADADGQETSATEDDALAYALTALEEETAGRDLLPESPDGQQLGPSSGPEKASEQPDGNPVPANLADGTSLTDSSESPDTKYEAEGTATRPESSGKGGADAELAPEPDLDSDLPTPENRDAVLRQAAVILTSLAGSEPEVNPAPARQPGSVPPSDPAVAESISAAREVLKAVASDDRAKTSPATVDEDKAEKLAAAVEAIIRKDKNERIFDFIKALASDPETFEELRHIARDPNVSADTIYNFTSKARQPEGNKSAMNGKLIVAAALLLAAGIAVPLVATAGAEIILTNEIAIAALIVAIAALRGS